MFIPCAGDPVWLFGCQDEFVVTLADYTAEIAIIILRSDFEACQRRTRFDHLFRDLESALAGVAIRPTMHEVLLSSRLCVQQRQALVQELRGTICSSIFTIQKSRTLIDATDRNIFRMQTLGYHNSEKMTASTHFELESSHADRAPIPPPTSNALELRLCFSARPSSACGENQSFAE